MKKRPWLCRHNVHWWKRVRIEMQKKLVGGGTFVERYRCRRCGVEENRYEDFELWG